MIEINNFRRDLTDILAKTNHCIQRKYVILAFTDLKFISNRRDESAARLPIRIFHESSICCCSQRSGRRHYEKNGNTVMKWS